MLVSVLRLVLLFANHVKLKLMNLVEKEGKKILVKRRRIKYEIDFGETWEIGREEGIIISNETTVSIYLKTKPIGWWYRKFRRRRVRGVM